MRLLLSALICASGLVTVPTSAEMLDTTYVMDPVVVTSTRTETVRRNLPRSVTVVSGEEMRIRGATSVIEGIVNAAPGISVTERGVIGFGLGSSSTGKVNIRGVGGKPNAQVLFLVDGRPDFVGLFSHPVPDAYALSQVERVEIVRGPSSAVYGTNAMGGVVNIVTRRRATPGHAVTLNALGGQWNTLDADVTALGATEYGIDYRVTAGHSRTDGHGDGTDFRRKHLSGSLGWRAGSWDLNATAAYTPFEGSSAGQVKGFDIVRASGTMSAEYDRGDLSSKVVAHWHRGDHQFSDGWDSQDYTYGSNGYVTYEFSGLGTATAGLDVKRYGGEAMNVAFGADFGAPSVTEVAPSVGLQVPLGGRAVVSAAALAQWHDRYGWFFAPEGGVAVHVNRALTLRGNVARGFRSPDLRALYLFPPKPLDQKTYAELEPERTLSTEIGAIFRPARWLVTDLTAFRITGDDVILTPPPAFRNGGSFTHTGIEFESRVSLPSVNGRLFGTWMDLGDNKENNAEFTAGASATTTVERFSLTLDGRWVMNAWDYAGVSGQFIELPDYLLLNATLSRPIAYGISGNITLRNILDQKYATEFEQWNEGGTIHSHYYYMPGFHVLVGLRAELSTTR